VPSLAPVVSRATPQPIAVRGETASWRVRLVRPPTMAVVYEWVGTTDPLEPRTFDERGEVIGNGLGSWQVNTFTEDDDLAGVLPGDLFQFVDRGYVIDIGPWRSKRTKLASVDGRNRYVTTWFGESAHGLLKQTLVYPAQGPGSIPVEEDRVLNWTSPDKDISGWAPVTEVELVDTAIGDPAGTGTWPSQPMGEGWPTGNGGTYFIGPTGADTNLAPTGFIYVAKDITVPVAGAHRIYMLIDNEGRGYVDGVPFMNISANDGFRRVSSILLELSAGTHRIAISAYNAIDDGPPGGNPIGIAFELWKADQGGFPETRIAITNDEWVGVFYPASPPGMTPGEAMRILLAESQDRDCITWLDPSFDAEVDSNGVQWTEYGDLACKTGRTPLWKFTEQLIAAGYIDSRISLNGRRWDLYIGGTLGVDHTADVDYVTDIDPNVANLQDWEQTTVTPRADKILAKSQFGWSEVSSASSGNSVEGVLGLGALQSQSEVDRWTQAQLDVYSAAQVQDDIEVEPVGLTDTPLIGFRTLDTVNVDGTPQIVASVSWQRDRVGRIKYTPHIGSRLAQHEERLRRAIESMVAGTFDGDSKLATPLDQIAYQSVADCCAPPAVEDPG
jgi:hypothetical protein